MHRPTFQRLEELFHRAAALPAAEQAAFLDRECAGEPALRVALEDMLRHDREDTTDDGPLASPVSRAASQLRHEAPTLPAGADAKAGRSALPQVPGYEILQELGRGGMGVVYKARQTGLNRLVALKMLLPFAVPTAEQLARFRTEAEVLARLSHPNVVPVYEIGECPAGPYFSMEYVAGPNLGAYLDGRPCDPAAAARLVEILAGAIDAVHRCGIVHRDLKPANVLLQMGSGEWRTGDPARGGRGLAFPLLLSQLPTPKLTDFGLAKDRSAGRALTVTGTALGTPCYMAPEQASTRGRGAGPAADVYALGVILYEMLAGRPPFEGATPVETIALLLDEDPPPLARLRPGVPRDLITVCMKCLEKSPRRRYATARDLAEDLRRFQAGESIRARPVGPLGRAYRWCRRRPLVASLTALCAALALALVGMAVNYDLRLEAELKAARDQWERERQEIIRLNVTVGATEMENGDTIAAVLRFTEALARDRESPAHEREHRARIHSALARSPRLIRLFATDETLLCARLYETGGRVATVAPDHGIEVRDAETGQPVGPVLRHGRAVTAGAFSPDGKSLATADAAGAALVWSVEDGTCRPLLPPAGEQVHALAFQGAGRLLLTRGDRCELKVWDLSGSEPVPVTPPVTETGGAGAIAEDGRLVLAFAEGVGRVWDVAAGKAVGPPLRSPAAVTRSALSPDGRRAAVVAADHTVRVGDVESGRWLTQPLDCGPDVETVVFSPDGERIVTGGGKRRTLIWRSATGRGGPRALIWKTATGELVAALRTPHAEIGYARFSTDGRLLVTGDGSGGGRVWDAATGRPVTPPLRHGHQLIAAAFSADGQQLTTAGGGGTVCRWQLAGAPGAADDPAARAAETWEIDRLTALARVLACGEIDASQQPHAYDSRRLRSDWDALNNATTPP
jgi:serine/threonine protein kinase